MIHSSKSDLAGQKVKIKSNVEHMQYKKFGGQNFVVEDWWDRVSGQSWKFARGNPAALVYAVRTAHTDIPLDDEVLYGHTENGLGHLVHRTEVDV